MPHSRHQFRHGVEQNVLGVRDVDDAVVCGEQQPFIGPQPAGELCDLTVKRLEGGQPFFGLPAVRVGCDVEFCDVEVHESPRILIEHPARGGETISQRLGGEIGRPAQRGLGET